MISEIDLKDYKEDFPARLYELADQRGKDKLIKIDGVVFRYGWLDGMYANVFDQKDHQYVVAAWTECRPLTKVGQEGL